MNLKIKIININQEYANGIKKKYFITALTA